MMSHEFMVMLAIAELLIVATLWVTAWMVVDRCVAKARYEAYIPRDIRMARGVVRIAPMAGAALGAFGARLMSTDPSGYGLSAIFGATLGLVAALRYVRDALRRTSPTVARSVAADKVGVATVMGAAGIGRQAVGASTRSLDQPYRPSNSDRRPPHLDAR